MTQPIPNPLANDEAQDITGSALQTTLVDLLDLSLVAKQLHWTLIGRHFHEVHRQLDAVVEGARTYADQVAERAAAIGVPPDGRTATVGQNSALPEVSPGWVNDRDVVEYMTQVLDTIVRRVRDNIEKTGEPDPVSQDLLITVSGAMEEQRWMWRAQNIGYQIDKTEV